MTTSTHRHGKYGDGWILGWYEYGMVMFQSNHGRNMLREESLTPLAAAPAVMTQYAEPPEMPSPTAKLETTRAKLEESLATPATAVIAIVEAVEVPPKKRKGKAGQVALKPSINDSDAGQIAVLFPQLGRVGAKKLADKKPVKGWVSLPSVRELAGELFPTEDSWITFLSIFDL